MRLDQMYQEVILDHYKHPTARDSSSRLTARSITSTPCGDEITLRVKLAGSPGEETVESVSFDSQGCSISQASAKCLA